MLRRASILPLLGLITLTAGCLVATSDTSGETGEHRYRATIQRTSFGIAHITADDMGSAGFGQGYAFAEDHLCVLADQILKVRSERAEYLGPGNDDAHIHSDIANKALDMMGLAEQARDRASADVLAMIQGYAAGYNHYLETTGVDNLPGPCRGQAWVKPIDELDLIAYYMSLGQVASSTQLLDFIATAVPPGSPDAVPGPAFSTLDLRKNGVGSNGWAIGKTKSATGRGMVLANPHFPWVGELRLWESHVTIPDKANLYGVSLMGVPGVNIGFNEHVAWTHTFSIAQRFAIYTLDLVPGDPTSYFYDGEPRKMTSQAFTIDVKQPDGSTAPYTQTIWYSHYGPIINALGFGWSNNLAVTYRDANLTNFDLIEQFVGMGMASSLQEFQNVFSEVKGMPWAHTMAADAEGNAWYIDAAATPNLTKEAQDGWIASLDDAGLPRLIWDEAGIMVLNGSDSKNEWVNAEGAREPGLIPPSGAPQLLRDDYVFNANDSHWLANPAAPLEGFSPAQGMERVPQSMRTRSNIAILAGTGPGSAAGDDGVFTIKELQDALFGNYGLATDLAFDQVLARCQATPPFMHQGVLVDLSDACAILETWDRQYNVDSVGATIWREFLGSFPANDLTDRGDLFVTAFDPDDPFGTPHTVQPAADTPEADPIARNLASAVLNLRAAGVPLDAPLGQVQYTKRGDALIPIHGGGSSDGLPNQVFYSILQTSLDPNPSRGEVINPTTDLTTSGYVINYGASFVMTMAYTDDGPEAEALLTYGQSDDPNSPHFLDQFFAFANEQWRPILFDPEDIAADPNLVETVVEGG